MRFPVILLLLLCLAAACYGQAPLTVTPASLAFTAIADSEAPPPQILLLYTAVATSVEFAVALDGGAPGVAAPGWISVNSARATSPARLVITVNQAGLPAGDAGTARILIQQPNGQALRDPIPVTLRVQQAPARLSVIPAYLSFSTQSARDPLDQMILVRNTGSGGVGTVTASVTTASSWLRATVDSCARECVVRVSALVAGLAAGAYRGTVRVATSLGSQDIPVNLFVTDRGPLMEINPGAVRFEARQGHGQGETRQVAIRNAGDGTLNWVAEVFRPAAWLRLSPSSGVSTSAAPASTELIVDPGSLAPGVYQTLVRVSSPELRDSPQYIPVSLIIAAADAPATPAFSTTGVLFRAFAGGAATDTQQGRLFTSSSSAISYQASPRVNRPAGIPWLAVSPSRETVASSSPRPLFFAATPGNLSAGVYTGEAMFWLGGSELRAVNAALVLTPPAPDVCQPARVFGLHTSLPDNFALRVGLPAPVSVQVFNDCGQAVTNAQVLVTFSNSDEAPVPLSHAGGGNYTGVWVPALSSAALPGGTIALVARLWASGLAAGEAALIGTVAEGRSPVLLPQGLLHNLNPQRGAALAPGTIVQVYGQNLASAMAEPVLTNRRLPTTLAGTTVIVGNIEAPVYYVSPGQLNIQLPTGLALNRQYQVVVTTDTGVTAPDTISIVPLAPGIAAFPDGRAIAQDIQFRLIDASNPLRRGDYFTIYLSGMGPTSPSVPTGMLPPDTPPFAEVLNRPEVRLDGRPAEVTAAVQSPCCVALYQVNARVPADSPTGDLKLTVVQAGVSSNETILPVR
jgi:uncharacterized protein (TIGR03437 family)